MGKPSLFQQFIDISKYCRWLEEEGRRENSGENFDRYMKFFVEHLKEKFDIDVSEGEQKELLEHMKGYEAVGSMRALMTAGPALARDNVAGYNCAYQSTKKARALDEMLYILMCGTGDGFSVERQYVNQLATVPEQLYPTDSTIFVRDSKIGWAKAVKEVVGMLYSGTIPNVDYSKLRAAGVKLKTFGGRSSGPEPLKELVNFIITTFKGAQGRQLSSIEAHDIMCFIAQVVVVGGVRRSACISLSNLSDDRMRKAKSGQWWVTNPQRALANNSVAYTEKPDMQTFMREWTSLHESKSGERGVFNRKASKKQVERSNDIRKEFFCDKARLRDSSYDFGCNPCSEIILRDEQFCNLSEAVVRAKDTIETLKDKLTTATKVGTWQSTLTDFRYLNKKWKENCEDERLLGVSMTGVMGHYVLSGQADRDAGVSPMDKKSSIAKMLMELRKHVIQVNMDEADRLGIPYSAATTCIKPSGTVSQLVNCSSGLHPWHNDYYIRTARGDKKDPLSMFMVDNGFPHEEDYMNPSAWVFSFPVKADEGAITRDDLTAIEMLEVWMAYQLYWCEHKPSVTINVREYEWMEVGAWVYKHFDDISGVSFLPYSDHVYRQAPYQDCTKEEYEAMCERMPKDVDWSGVSEYEKEDTTTGMQEYACTAGVCEIVDISK